LLRIGRRKELRSDIHQPLDGGRDALEGCRDELFNEPADGTAVGRMRRSPADIALLVELAHTDAESVPIPDKPELQTIGRNE